MSAVTNLHTPWTPSIYPTTLISPHKSYKYIESIWLCHMDRAIWTTNVYSMITTTFRFHIDVFFRDDDDDEPSSSSLNSLYDDDDVDIFYLKNDWPIIYNLNFRVTATGEGRWNCVCVQGRRWNDQKSFVPLSQSVSRRRLPPTYLCWIGTIIIQVHFVVPSRFIIVVVEQCIQDHHHTINLTWWERIFQYDMMERTVYDPKKIPFLKKTNNFIRFFCLRRKPNIPPKPLLEYTRRKHTLKKLRKYIQDGKEERR